MQRSSQNSDWQKNNISDRLIRKADIVDAEFEVIESDQAASDAQSFTKAKYGRVHTQRSQAEKSAKSAQFFKQPIPPQAYKSTSDAPPNRAAFYTISAVLILFSFWWTGGYMLFAPANNTQNQLYNPVAKFAPESTLPDLDQTQTSAIKPASSDNIASETPSFQTLESAEQQTATKQSTQTLDAGPQITKNKSSFVFATSPSQGSHRSLQFQPSY